MPSEAYQSRMRVMAILSCLLFIFLLSGCSLDAPAQASVPFKGSSVSVIDTNGRRILLEKPAVRIASMSPGFTETLFAVGCGDSVVLRDPWSDFPEAAKRIPATDGVSLSVPNIAGFSPDLVLLYFKDDRNVEAFGKLGIEVAVFDPKTYAEVAEMVEKLATLCGRAENGKRVAAEMRRQAVFDSAISLKERPRMFIEVDGSDVARPWTAGRTSFVSEIAEMAGARNVMGYLEMSYAQVSAEEVIRSNPDYILLLSSAQDERDERIRAFGARPGFGTMDAIREKRIIADIDRDLLTRVGPRLADGLARLRAALRERVSK